MLTSIKNYYSLIKPRVTYSNALTAVSGFLFASSLDSSFNLVSFLALSIGVTLIIASACVLNNYLDRDIDAKMTRTKQRVIASGAVTGYGPVIFSTLLGLAGAVSLWLYTSWLVVVLGLAGFVTYVVLYGMLGKRLSWHGTLAGSVSGAIPIVAGYVAVSGQFDLVALVLFAILFLWQEPAFYSIAIFRRPEYQAAQVPVISVVHGNLITARYIYAYSWLYVLSTLTLPLVSSVGWVYTVIMTLLGAIWIAQAQRGLKYDPVETWARQMFRLSIITITFISLFLPFAPLLP